MILGNRFHAVRRLGPLSGGLGRRYILERRRAQWPAVLVPDGPEWVRLHDGRVVPAIHGGAGGTYVQGYEVPSLALFRLPGAGSQTTHALDSAYANGTGGDAIASRIQLPRVETLASVYAFIGSYTGTAANVNDLNFEFRDNSFTTGPSTTLHDSVTKDPASATGWISATWSTGFTTTEDVPYWIILGDADGNTTDYATVLRNTNTFGAMASAWISQAAQTTDGWTSVRTFAGNPGALVVAFTSGRVIGSPFSASTGSPNNTNRRGLRFVAPATCKLYGALLNGSVAVATLTGLELWTGTDGPNGSPTATGAVDFLTNAVTSAVFGHDFTTAPTLTQGTAYRLVFTYGANSTLPSKLNIGTGADDTLRSAMLGGGAWYWAGANGTTDWSNDDTSAQPAMDVLIDDGVTESVEASQLVNSGALVG